MGSMTIEYRSLEGTGASIGLSGKHTVIADRPEGKAGGTGLGFNGGELLALSLGGCFCNDVHYTAYDMGVVVLHLQVNVTIHFDGDPLLASSAEVQVQCQLADGVDPDDLIERATARCTVANSLKSGVKVTFH